MASYVQRNGKWVKVTAQEAEAERVAQQQAQEAERRERGGAGRVTGTDGRIPTSNTGSKYTVYKNTERKPPLKEGEGEIFLAGVTIRFDEGESVDAIVRDWATANNVQVQHREGGVRVVNRDESGRPTRQATIAADVKLGPSDAPQEPTGRDVGRDVGGGGTSPPELPEGGGGGSSDQRREPVTVADTSGVNLPGLRSRQSIATGGNAAANRVSQAAQGALAGGQLSQRAPISSDVGPQFRVQQLSVNQDLQGRATAEQTAAAGIRADLPDRIAAQRSVTARGQQRGRASTILTGGGAAGLGSQPANTLGRRRLTSGQVRPGAAASADRFSRSEPAPSPAAQSQAGEAAEQQVRVQQRQGVRAEQDRQEAPSQDPPQDPRRSVSPRETERDRRRRSLITGEGTGDRPTGQSGGGGGQSFEGFTEGDLEGRVRDFQDEAAAAELRRRRGGAQTRGGGNVGRGRSLLNLDAAALRRGEGAALGISGGQTRVAARGRTTAQLTEFIRRRNARLNADVNAARRARG